MKALFHLMVACILSAGLAACASRPQPKEDPPSPLLARDRLLLVSSGETPLSAEYYALGAGKGAKRGMGEGSVAGGGVGLHMVAEGLPFTLFPPLAAVLVGSGVVVGGISGGIAGVINASDAEEASCSEDNLRKALGLRAGNEHLVQELQTRLHELGADTPLVETPHGDFSYLLPKLVAVELKKLNHEKEFRMVLRSTVLRVDGPSARSFGNIDYISPPKPLFNWCREGSSGSLRQLDAGMIRLSRMMAERLLLENKLDLLSTSECPAFRGLVPVRPPIRRFFLGGLSASPVDTLQPLLEWEPFPQPVDTARGPDLPSRLSDIVYDLRVWEADPGHVPWVYSRTGLTRTAHRVEVRLKPGSQYFWTVRPRFLFDGMRRILPWSVFTYDCSSPLGAARVDHPYRFVTPGARRQF